MAVFWFGLGKKIKNVFTKKEADQLYLSKTDNNLQIVQGAVDFYGNIVAKRNGYVDYVDTNTPTSMINKQYFETELTSYADKQYLYDYVREGQQLRLLSQTPDNVKLTNMQEIALSIDGFNYNPQAPVIVMYTIGPKANNETYSYFYNTIKIPQGISQTYKHCVSFNDMYYSKQTSAFEKTDKFGLCFRVSSIDQQTKTYIITFRAQLFGQAGVDFCINKIALYGVR